MRRPVSLAFACLALVAGCAQPVRETDASASPPQVFVLVRHAEKATDDPKDPSLSEVGQARAQRLAISLKDVDMTAVYATAYRRTQQTALPTAAEHGLVVTTYDASESTDDLAARLRSTYRRGTMLVVGHSNTIPSIAAALCRCMVAPMGEDEYDRRIEVRIAADGDATLDETRY